MKMTRQDLKHLVKECLVEILSEGLVESARVVNENRRPQAAPVPEPRQQAPRAAPPARQTVADKISFLPSRGEMATQQPARQQRPSIAAGLTNDPILSEVFADTERSGRHLSMTESPSSPHRVSYEEMVAVGGDAAAKKMLRSDPIEIFGESTSKWAALAFAEKTPAGSRAG
jgi:hypothetical protein